MQTKNINWKGAYIHYQVTGSCMLFVLLHGFAEDGLIWKNQTDALQEKFQLIIPDIPGSGLSDLVADATIETYVAIIKEILDTELNKNADGIIKEPATFFGHSMGGYICLVFAEKHPEYLNSFGLLHSSAFADSAEKNRLVKKQSNSFKQRVPTVF